MAQLCNIMCTMLVIIMIGGVLFVLLHPIYLFICKLWTFTSGTYNMAHYVFSNATNALPEEVAYVNQITERAKKIGEKLWK